MSIHQLLPFSRIVLRNQYILNNKPPLSINERILMCHSHLGIIVGTSYRLYVERWQDKTYSLLYTFHEDLLYNPGGSTVRELELVIAQNYIATSRNYEVKDDVIYLSLERIKEL